MTVTPAPLRDAATVILLREAAAGAPQVLLLRRHARSGFAARAWVFPGGVADPGDRLLPAASRGSVDERRLADLLGRPPDVALGLVVAAIRETFEEAGLLLAHTSAGAAPDLSDPAVVRMRRALAQRGAVPAADFNAWVAGAGLVLDLGALVPFSRWLTPAVEPRRYDTVFFLARAPQGQVAEHDEVETTGLRWTTAADALADARRGELQLIYPTLRTLEALAVHPDLGALLAAAPRTRLRPLQPHAVTDADGRVTAILHPDDPAYPWDRYPELRAAASPPTERPDDLGRRPEVRR